jgi:O-antigen/teichoic acid export membrane protein
MKRMTKEPWFGKKNEAIGLRPISWHGWFTSFLFLITLFGLLFLQVVNYQYMWLIVSGILVIIIIFLLITIISSDEKDRSGFN